MPPFDNAFRRVTRWAPVAQLVRILGKFSVSAPVDQVDVKDGGDRVRLRAVYPSVIVAIEDAGRRRKVLRIITTRDGSVAILPLHLAPVGMISKFGAPAILMAPGSGWTALLDSHLVGEPVKLIYHPTGFVQFSSACQRKVRSGESPPDRFHMPKYGSAQPALH